MNLNDFSEMLCEVITTELPGDIIVKTRDVLKNNGNVRRGIVFIEKNINASPTIYLEYHYEMFIKGIDISEIASDVISQFYENRLSVGVDVDFFSYFEEVKENLFCKLINKDLNEDYLKGVPYKEFHDLAVVVYCRLNDFEFGDATITIRDEHLKLWSVSKEVLFDAAMENTRNRIECKIENISTLINSLSMNNPQLNITEIPCDMDVPMYVVTNENKMMGAVYMIFKDIMDGLCDVAGDEYFVLPSSIHEFIVVPKQEGDEKGYYDNMVCEVNSEHVNPEEILANHAYMYIKGEGFLI